MDLMKSVLSDIKAGTRNFKPDGDSPDDLAAFQAVAQRLQSAERQRFISRLSVRVSKMRDSYGNVTNALVTGGLTFEGEQALEALQHPPQAKAEEPVLVLKPSLYGVGIDLRAAYKKISALVARDR